MKIRLFSLIIIGFILTGCQTSSNVSEDEPPVWISYKISKITLEYPSNINLRKLEARLRTRYFSVSAVERNLFSNSSYAIESRIISRIEAIMLRIEQILAMNPPYMELKIKIFRDRRELNQEHCNLFGAMQNYKSFYVHSLGTIYTSMQDVSDSVISHEITHAVIDNYFQVMPPAKTAELLATYVDSHLEKE